MHIFTKRATRQAQEKLKNAPYEVATLTKYLSKGPEKLDEKRK
jgi:hypothetical protein